MPRSFTTDQRRGNAAFLRALAATGNVREAARRTGIAYGTVQNRRRSCAAFAQRWDAALATAQARLHEGGGARRPAGKAADPRRTAGGEPVVIRTRDGRLQLRRAQPGKLTGQAEQAFLLALSATCNVTLSAAAAGASAAAFLRRRRRNPAFAREMRLAMEQGFERLEMALMESWSPASGDDAAWRDGENDVPALPPMTPNQALQLMYLHQKEARLWDEKPYMKCRAGETLDQRSARISEVYLNTLVEQAENATIRKVLGDEAKRRHREPAVPGNAGPGPIPLPDLAQVTGWSAADPDKTPHDPGRALFGGFRIRHMTDEEREKARVARERAAAERRLLRGE